jgi:hypothetical protein
MIKREDKLPSRISEINDINTEIEEPKVNINSMMMKTVDK